MAKNDKLDNQNSEQNSIPEQEQDEQNSEQKDLSVNDVNSEDTNNVNTEFSTGNEGENIGNMLKSVLDSIPNKNSEGIVFLIGTDAEKTGEHNIFLGGGQNIAFFDGKAVVTLEKAQQLQELGYIE